MMKSMAAKVKIIVVGPSGCGKTRISNFLADASTGVLEPDLIATHGARILEFDVPKLNIQNNNSTDVEVQLWDCSGDERYMTCWPAIRKNADGIIFIYSPNQTDGIRKLELFYNYFVSQQGFSPKQCIVFSHLVESDAAGQQTIKLPPTFSRISQATVNLETASEKLRFDFGQFLTTVLTTK